MNAPRSVPVRSYRDVVDVVERRIFRVDRWRIPTPGGVPAAALGYFACSLVLVLVLTKLPLIGVVLAPLDPILRYFGFPLLAAWALSSWQIDGRRPHFVLASAVRGAIAPKVLAGFRRAPAPGARLVPIASITIAPSGDEPTYRRGRVRGPATLALRYPARIEIEGRPRRAPACERLAHARRLRVFAAPGASRPLLDAHVLRIPSGAEVHFE